MRRDVWPAAALLVAGWALTLRVMPWSDERINDLGVYRGFAAEMVAGGLPYRDFFFEYPPLSAPVLWLPGVFGTGYESYRISFAIATLLLALVVMLLLAALAERTGGERRRALCAAALMPLLCGAMLRTHFDLAPVAIVLAALWLLCSGRARLGLAALGVGALVKGFPLVVVPVALAWLAGRGLRREAWQGALACAAVIGSLSLAALALSPDGAIDTLRYHQERPVQVESTPAVALLALDAVGLGRAELVSSHGSEGLDHPVAGVAEGLSAALVLIAVGLFSAAAARGPDQGSERRLVLAALAAVTAFAALGKVLSPQFLVWVYPLGALAFAWRMPALTGAVALALALTFVEFPAHYLDYLSREGEIVLVVALRDLALLAALGLALARLQPRRREDLLDRRRPAVAAGVD